MVPYLFEGGRYGGASVFRPRAPAEEVAAMMRDRHVDIPVDNAGGPGASETRARPRRQAGGRNEARGRVLVERRRQQAVLPIRTGTSPAGSHCGLPRA